jgi:hypothetical protein
VEQPGACRVILLDLRTAWQRTARARRAGLAKAEPGAGSAGRGAAQRRRLDLVRLNSAVVGLGAEERGRRGW